MCTRWILVLIIHDTNKIACRPTIRSRNGWGARNVLYFLSFSSIEEQPLFSFLRLSFSSSLLPCLFLPLYFHFDGGILLLFWFTFRRVYKHRGSFTLQFGYFVRINIWCRFRKSHLTGEAKCIWYRYPLCLFENRSRVPTSTQPIPWDTVFQSIYILSLLRKL